MGFDWGNAFRAGATGAAVGSVVPGIGTLAGGALGAVGGLFGGRKNRDEEKRINDLLAKVPNELKHYLQPYITAGQGALPGLQDVGGEFASQYKDPNAIISRIGAGYTQSPGYNWRLEQGENAINNAAAAGGYAGTAQHQQRAGQLAEDMATQDYNDFVARSLGLREAGLTGRRGIEENLYGIGAGAGGSLATSLANLLQGEAGLEYTRGANRNQLNSDLLSTLITALTKK